MAWKLVADYSDGNNINLAKSNLCGMWSLTIYTDKCRALEESMFPFQFTSLHRHPFLYILLA